MPTHCAVSRPVEAKDDCEEDCIVDALSVLARGPAVASTPLPWSMYDIILRRSYITTTNSQIAAMCNIYMYNIHVAGKNTYKNVCQSINVWSVHITQQGTFILCNYHT